MCLHTIRVSDGTDLGPVCISEAHPSVHSILTYYANLVHIHALMIESQQVQKERTAGGYRGRLSAAPGLGSLRFGGLLGSLAGCRLRLGPARRQ